MTIGQALDYLLQGRKLRHQHWGKDSYIRYQNNEIVCCDSDVAYNFNSIMLRTEYSKGWELVNQRLGNLKAGQKFTLVDSEDKKVYIKPVGVDHYGLYDTFRLQYIHASTPVEVVE